MSRTRTVTEACVCLECQGTWQGCWERGDRQRKCIWCGHEWIIVREREKEEASDAEHETE